MRLEFGTAKDPHYSLGFQNRIRKNYENQIITKNNFIGDYCQGAGIKQFFFTGDVFDSSMEDKWSFKKYRKNKRLVSSLGKDRGIELLSNVGNHDMFHGLEHSDGTVFGEMVYDGLLRNVTTHPFVMQEDNNIIKIQGVDYSHEKNTVLDYCRVFDEEEIPDMNYFKVIILHSNIVPDIDSDPNKALLDFSYTQLAESFTDIDMFICGHYHIGFPTTTYTREDGSKCVFINNWNMTRVVRDYETELDNHTPEFEHVCITGANDQDGNFQFTVDTRTIKIPFDSYKDTFEEKVINLLKQSKRDIFKFFDDINIEALKDDNKIEDDDIILKIQKERIDNDKEPFSQESIVKAIYYLNNAKEN